MWNDYLSIIARYGLPLGEKLWQLAASKTEPTAADWDALKALADKDAAAYLREAQRRADIARTATPAQSPKTPPPPPE